MCRTHPSCVVKGGSCAKRTELKARLQPIRPFPHLTSGKMAAAVIEQTPQVLARAAHGDPSSFSRLIEPLLDPAYRLAAVMLEDRSAAEDAVQEASVKAWRKLRQLRGDTASDRKSTR